MACVAHCAESVIDCAHHKLHDLGTGSVDLADHSSQNPTATLLMTDRSTMHSGEFIAMAQ